MAIYIHCPQCNQRLEEMRQDCAHCGAGLPPGIVYALASALGEAPMPPPMSTAGVPPHVRRPAAPIEAEEPLSPPQNSAWRPWLAAVLSLCCGLGQLYNGQLLKGLILIALGAAALVSLPLTIGKIMLPLVWAYAAIDAFVVARRSLPPSLR